MKIVKDMKEIWKLFSFKELNYYDRITIKHQKLGTELTFKVGGEAPKSFLVFGNEEFYSDFRFLLSFNLNRWVKILNEREHRQYAVPKLKVIYK